MSTAPPVWIDQAPLAAAWRDRIAAADAIALDTEFHAEGCYQPQLWLIQLAIPDAPPLLLDPRAADAMAILAPVLRHAPRWILHAGDRDVVLLQDALGGLPARIDDTQVLAGLTTTRYPASLADLLQRHLGVTADKGATLSDWSARPLDEAQLRYAADDVRHLRALADVLWDAVDARARTAIAHQACADRCARSLSTTLDDEAWRDVATRARHPDEARAVQALMVWRDAEARRLDRPTGYILNDALLRRLARTRPTSPLALEDDRRIRPGLVRKHGAAIIDTLAASAALPEPALCPPDGPADRLRAWLRMAADATGAAQGFSGSLALPDRTAHALAATGLDPLRTTAILAPWQNALLRDVLDATARGTLRLRWDGSDLASERDSCAPSPPSSAT